MKFKTYKQKVIVNILNSFPFYFFKKKTIIDHLDLKPEQIKEISERRLKKDKLCLTGSTQKQKRN